MEHDLSKVGLVVFDVDGVLTDGRLYYGNSGEMMKAFHVRDGVGIKLLEDNGITVAIISAKSSVPLAKRVAELGVSHFLPGSRNKVEALEAVVGKTGVSLELVVFVGDDMIDLPPMQRVGFSMAPSDAYVRVREAADIVLQTAGGQGVAREVADLVLGSQFDLDDLYDQATLPGFERVRTP
jgi:3-deoxy-D-manno-octulosonate 8-phosphate phosphatase (KDO 8-P phosphatase)